MGRSEESAILTWTDSHYGKRTSTFDADVCRTRLDNLGAKVKKLRSLKQKEVELTDLKLFFLGDCVDGLGIYPTQPHHLAIQDPMTQVEQFAEYVAEWLTKQKKAWGSVSVEAVPGNHGRTSKYNPEQTNWDRSFYQHLALHLGKSIPVNLTRDGDMFLHKAEVRGFNYLLYHGAGIKCFNRIPWYGIESRVKDWAVSPLAPFDVFTFGHFHTTWDYSINERIRCMGSGTPVTDDEWSRQELGREPSNRWWFWGVSDERPVTWSYDLELI